MMMSVVMNLICSLLFVAVAESASKDDKYKESGGVKAIYGLAGLCFLGAACGLILQ